MSKHRLMPIPKPLEKLTGMIETIADHCYGHQSFQDFLEMSAISLSNAVDKAHYEEREARYLAIIRKYRKLEDRVMFPKMLAELAFALETTGEDVLGPISSALGLTSFSRGQFWSPWDVCMLMAALNLDNKDNLNEAIAKKGFVTLQEPACGTGNMVMAFAKTLKNFGYNPQKQMHAVLIDSAPWCVHMAYCQLALMDIPAVVVMGDSLRMQMAEYWYTPRHVFGGWNARLRDTGAWLEKPTEEIASPQSARALPAPLMSEMTPG